MNAPLNRLEELYRAHARELKTYARRRVGMQEAEDVVHDVYLNLLQKRRAATFAHPKAYLFRAARNAAVDALRKKLTRARHVEDAAQLRAQNGNWLDSPPTIETQVALTQMCAFLNELPPPCRSAFLHYWLDDMSQQEIARHVGVTLRTVERRLAKALEHLRDRAEC